MDEENPEDSTWENPVTCKETECFDNEEGFCHDPCMERKP